MMPIDGQPILTAAGMRAAEDNAIAAGSSVSVLMERAGAGVAEAVRRLAAGSPVQIVCGPGNNGGDGYIAARLLKVNGVDVRVSALGEPRTAAAVSARRALGGAIAPFADTDPAPVLVDALFGTGLSRAPDEAVAEKLSALIDAAQFGIAVDLPSFLDADTGTGFAETSVRPFDLTLALGALKPAHVLMPAAHYCGAVRVIDLGLAALDHTTRVNARPSFLRPTATDHKYSRGLVVVIGGAMPGAARLAAEAAGRAGAGYVMLLGDDDVDAAPHAIVRRRWSRDALSQAVEGKRNRVLLVGPGLGRDATARERLDTALAIGGPLVIDGDALHLLNPTDFSRFEGNDIVLTPHEGEFRALFGDWQGSKIDATRRAADRAGATIVHKGPDTVVVTRSGDVIVSFGATPWLSTAGSGDVLAGAVAAAVVNGAVGDPAAAAVWMHGEAARRLGGAFIADDLARELSDVRAVL